MHSLLIDLHIHTVLSPCAEVEMIPPLIVRRALELGLALIGIADHNCAANAAAVIEAARDTSLTVLPGMEVQTREEVHMLCVFDTLEQVEDWQRTVDAALPGLPNREDFFGAQYVVDATGAHRYTEERLLATSTSLSVEQVAAGVEALGGLCIPAHIDRPSFSILSNLGFIPPGLPVAGLEISPRAIGRAKIGTGQLCVDEKSTFSTTEAPFSSSSESRDTTYDMEKPAAERLTSAWKSVEYHAGSARYGVLVSSDAHRLSEMGAYTRLRIAACTVAELRLALSGERGRRTWLLSESK
jgi:3',5'-nucleoside bisphosphate phosphatase